MGWKTNCIHEGRVGDRARRPLSCTDAVKLEKAFGLNETTCEDVSYIRPSMDPRARSRAEDLSANQLTKLALHLSNG